MNDKFQFLPAFRSRLAAFTLLALVTAGAAGPASAAYVQTNLVSSVPGLAAITDPSLVNPWGLSQSPTGPFWVSDQGTSVSTLYIVNGVAVTQAALIVAIPQTGGGPQGPTGQVNNTNPSSFHLSSGQPALFIFANLNGTLSAWSPSVSFTTSVVQVSTPGAVYTGLAINSAGTRLYAANGASGNINVFDSSFAPLTLPGAFTDPSLPAGFVPFNVQNIGGRIYVTYAPAGPAAQRSATTGQGIVNVFDENGVLLQRLITGSQLASPWGIALAPAGFGAFGGDLLVGNFSFAASEINAFDPLTGVFQGSIPIDVGVGNTPGGLWGMMFGSGSASGGNANTLYFADGINGEAGGLFAALAATAAVSNAPEPASLALLALGLASLAFARRRAHP